METSTLTVTTNNPGYISDLDSLIGRTLGNNTSKYGITILKSFECISHRNIPCVKWEYVITNPEEYNDDLMTYTFGVVWRIKNYLNHCPRTKFEFNHFVELDTFES